MAKKGPAGAPLWMVTFADLMSLLVCFFVLIISFSIPDIEKLKIAAGSIRDAFGIQKKVIVTGVVELDGSPMYEFAQTLVPWQIDTIVGPIPDESRDMERITAYQSDWRDLLEQTETLEGAGTSQMENGSIDEIKDELLEQIRTNPDLQELEQNLIIEERPEGIRIQLVDQADFSMFPLGGVRMYDATRQLLKEVAGVIAPLPHAIEVTGHTDGYAFRSANRMDNWTLSLGRADETRRVLIESGLGAERLDNVSGKADSDHLYPANPYDPRNRRISITLLRPEDEAATRPTQEPVTDAWTTSTASSPRTGQSQPSPDAEASLPFRESRWRPLYRRDGPATEGDTTSPFFGRADPRDGE